MAVTNVPQPQKKVWVKNQAIARNAHKFGFNTKQKGFIPKPKSVVLITFPELKESEIFYKYLMKNDLKFIIIGQNGQDPKKTFLPCRETIINLAKLVDEQEKQEVLCYLRKNRKLNKWHLRYVDALEIDFPLNRSSRSYQFQLKEYFISRIWNLFDREASKVANKPIPVNFKKFEMKKEEIKIEFLEKIDLIKHKYSELNLKLNLPEKMLDSARIELETLSKSGLLEQTKQNYDSCLQKLANLKVKKNENQENISNNQELVKKKLNEIEKEVQIENEKMAEKRESLLSQIKQLNSEIEDVLGDDSVPKYEVNKIMEGLDKIIKDSKEKGEQLKREFQEINEKNLSMFKKNVSQLNEEIEIFNSEIDNLKVSLKYAIQLHETAFEKIRMCKKEIRTISNERQKNWDRIRELENRLTEKLAELDSDLKKSKKTQAKSSRKTEVFEILKKILPYINKYEAFINELAIERVFGIDFLNDFHKWMGQKTSTRYSTKWEIKKYFNDEEKYRQYVKKMDRLRELEDRDMAIFTDGVAN